MLHKGKLETKIVERVVVPLYGQESVLLHVDVFRNKDNSWCVSKTFATLQLKNKNVVETKQKIDFILDCDGFVINKTNDKEAITCVAGQKRLKVYLFSWLMWIKFLDSNIDQYYKELRANCLWYFNKNTYQEQILNNEKLLPGLPLFKSPEKLVYLIGNKKEGLIKIGISQDVKQRLAHLQSVCPSPLEIIATKRGTFDTEKELHRKFQQFRKHGEWFTWDESIIAQF